MVLVACVIYAKILIGAANELSIKYSLLTVITLFLSGFARSANLFVLLDASALVALVLVPVLLVPSALVLLVLVPPVLVPFVCALFTLHRLKFNVLAGLTSDGLLLLQTRHDWA